MGSDITPSAGTPTARCDLQGRESARARRNAPDTVVTDGRVRRARAQFAHRSFRAHLGAKSMRQHYLAGDRPHNLGRFLPCLFWLSGLCTIRATVNAASRPAPASIRNGLQVHLRLRLGSCRGGRLRRDRPVCRARPRHYDHSWQLPCRHAGKFLRQHGRSGKVYFPEDGAVYFKPEPKHYRQAFWLADTRTDGDLKAFLNWRCTVGTSLVLEICGAVRKDATVAVIPSVVRPTGGAWYEGVDLKALAEAAVVIEACFYEASPTRVAADLHDQATPEKRRQSSRHSPPGLSRSRAEALFPR